jgi:predicted ester cyclase
MVDHQNYGPGYDFDYVGGHGGREGIRQLVTSLRIALPDLHSTIDDIVGVGDKTFARVTTRGTHTGEYLNIDPTGNPISIDIMDVCRFQDQAPYQSSSTGVSPICSSC